MQCLINRVALPCYNHRTQLSFRININLTSIIIIYTEIINNLFIDIVTPTSQLLKCHHDDVSVSLLMVQTYLLLYNFYDKTCDTMYVGTFHEYVHS